MAGRDGSRGTALASFVKNQRDFFGVFRPVLEFHTRIFSALEDEAGKSKGGDFAGTKGFHSGVVRRSRGLVIHQAIELSAF
jgi:hypothetical protein